MTSRQKRCYEWLLANPGWHTIQEIGKGALGRPAKDLKKVYPAFAGPLRKLHAMGYLDAKPSPGGRVAYKVKDKDDRDHSGKTN